ncbi:MAG: hypothetical protein PQJ46_15145 [Spirochaetales bacterium]|nr:hypothetical protein [Spirochaetales bacterium]
MSKRWGAVVILQVFPEISKSRPLVIQHQNLTTSLQRIKDTK